ncbi:MAG: hypothetical protein HYS44_01865 [Candidatus Niyogibacteria bacterium]|nr:hypothetical protein [Candidatus Niyogibacteria bacterium]
MHPILERHAQNRTFANAYIVVGFPSDALLEFLRTQGAVESYAGGALGAPDSPARRSGIDGVRDIREKAFVVRHDRLFFVLDADGLSWQSYPALLKLIEEPPAGRHFVLTATSIESVPETVQSRAVALFYERPRGGPFQGESLGAGKGLPLGGRLLNAEAIEAITEDAARFSEFLDNYEQWARSRPDAGTLLNRVQAVRAAEKTLNLGRKMCLEYLMAFKNV